MTDPLSKTIKDFTAALKPGSVKVSDITKHFEDRSIAFFLFLCAMPAAIPMPGLGVNLIIAAPLILLTLQLATSREHIWLPKKLANRSISKIKLEKISEAILPWIIRLENLSRPRLNSITEGPFKPLIGLLSFAMALSVCIPLPLTNTVPSMGIALMALGVLTKDGLAVITGAIIGTSWILLISFAFFILGMEGLDLIRENIKSVF